MQDALFPDASGSSEATSSHSPQTPMRGGGTSGARVSRIQAVLPAAAQSAHLELATCLPPSLHLGTSSWSYPGWIDLVWQGEHSEAMLSKRGLSAYGQHPLFRTVSVDRAFYRALTVSQYAAHAAQVPDDFRFVVKAPSAVADAMVRSEQGKSLQANPLFLDPEWAVREFVQPALEGLRHKVGALVFQLSPLPPDPLRQLPRVLAQLDRMLGALPALAPTAPDGVIAVEVRDPAFLTPAFANVLRAHGARYCLGLHAKMPPIDAQLPVLRALWPGPLVCRWNLNRLHGAYGYEEARTLYEPYTRIVDADPHTHEVLAKVAAATVKAGHKAYITLSNKAEGCAPLSVERLAQAIAARLA